MPHTRRVSGASLVPDIRGLLNPLSQAFEARGVRQEEAQKQGALQREIDTLGSSSLTPGQEDAALFRIGQLGTPQMANSFRQILKRRDEVELAETQKMAEQGARDAVFLKGIKDPLTRQREITKIAERQIADKIDPRDTMKLADLPFEEQNLAIEGQIILAQDFDTLLANATATKPGFTLSEGQVRFGPGGSEIARGAAKITTPSTTIGKARADLKAGNITQAEFNQIKKAPTQDFKSSVGKLIGDKQLATDIFGEDSEQVKAIDDVIKADTKGESPSLSDVGGIRKEFTKLSGAFIELRDAIAKVEQSNLNPSPAGDLALIFNFMKIQDPASVVRESEFATAQNATNLPGRLGAAAQRVITGERMLPEQRQDFVDTANRLFQAQKLKQIQLEGSFRDIAERQGITVDDVIIDFIGEKERNRDRTIKPPPDVPPRIDGITGSTQLVPQTAPVVAPATSGSIGRFEVEIE